MKLASAAVAATDPTCLSWLPPDSSGSGMPRWAVQRLDRVRERARQLQQARGAVGGADLQDWLQAEQEIEGEE